MIQIRSLLDTVNVRPDLKPARVLRAIRDGIRQAATEALLIRSTEALTLTSGASVVNFSTDIQDVVGNEKKQLVAFTGLKIRPVNSHTDAFRDLGRPTPIPDFKAISSGRAGTPAIWTQMGEELHIHPIVSNNSPSDFCDIQAEYSWVPGFDDDFETVQLCHSEVSLIIPLIKSILLGITPIADGKQAQMARTYLGEYRMNVSRLRSMSRTGKEAIGNLTAVRYPGAP